MRDSIFKLCKKFFVMPWSAALLAIVGAGALCTAFIAQYFFDVFPCVLCLWQRVPYGVIIFIAGLALILKPYNKRTALLLGLCSLALFVGMGIAVFHSGVERHWWIGTDGCELQPLSPKSDDIASLREQLLATPAVPCDQITWSFLGLSFANWNVFVSLFWALFAAIAARKTWRPQV